MEFNHSTALKQKPELPFKAIHSLGFKRQEKGYHTPLHIRKDYQFYFCISKRIKLFLNGEWSDLEPGECILIPASVQRAYKGTGKGSQYLLIHFTPNDGTLMNLYENKITLHASSQLIVDLITKELSSESTYKTEQMVYALITQLFIDIVRHTFAKDKHLVPQDDRIRIIERTMRNNLHKPLGREEFAKAASLSVSHVGYLYQRATGKTLITRLTEVRIEEAKRLLENSTLPITYIALDVGFNSFSHFTQLFKRHVGASPSDFRKKVNF